MSSGGSKNLVRMKCLVASSRIFPVIGCIYSDVSKSIQRCIQVTSGDGSVHQQSHHTSNAPLIRSDKMLSVSKKPSQAKPDPGPLDQ